MLANFWRVLGTKVFERWATVLGSAIVFWSGGLLAWLWRYRGLDRLQDEFPDKALTSAPVILAATLVIIASAVVVQHLTFPVVRFLEGYWPTWLQPLQRSLARRTSRRIEQDEEKWQDLASVLYRLRESDKHTELELMRAHDKYMALDRRLRLIPTTPENRMPTRLGNILRAAETWPRDKYGLDTAVCWPRLWFILPDTVKRELAQARASLDSGAAVWLWGLLFVVWTIWAWWAIPLGLITCIGAYLSMLSSARLYGDLIESAFDLYRITLYQAIRWPLPTNPSEEKELGEAVTEYLWRGSDSSYPKYIWPEPLRERRHLQ
jgi:hypothetical protein